MRFTLNVKYLVMSIIFFLTEVLIAVYFKTGFIRHTVGDFLVVMLLYCFFKSFFKINSEILAIVTLGIAFCIEFLQLTRFLEYLGLRDNTFANLILGNAFSVHDLLAFTLGVMVILSIDRIGLLRKKLDNI